MSAAGSASASDMATTSPASTTTKSASKTPLTTASATSKARATAAAAEGTPAEPVAGPRLRVKRLAPTFRLSDNRGYESGDTAGMLALVFALGSIYFRLRVFVLLSALAAAVAIGDKRKINENGEPVSFWKEALSTLMIVLMGIMMAYFGPQARAWQDLPEFLSF